MKTTVLTLAFASAALSLTACGMFSGQPQGLAQVDDLVGCIERVHVDSEVAREKAALAMTNLRQMTALDFQGDAVLAHAELVKSIEDAEKQATDLRHAVDRMKRAAEPVFTRWAKDLETMQSPELKQRSQTRYDDTRRRYDAIVAASDPTLVAFDAFNRTLRDHALFMGHDFNTSAVAAIVDDVRKLQGANGELAFGFERCMQTARAYIDAAALPMRVEAARPAR